jgi:hypothetical protein
VVCVGSWPIATNFSLGLDVSFRGEAEVGREAEPAASVENDPFETSLLDEASIVGGGQEDPEPFLLPDDVLK